jgi:N-acetylmuramoyl-L-alanine amidase
VIDPGHGGHDTGAEGVGKATEKEAALQLSRELQSQLSRNFRVILTRTGDYRVSPRKRVAIANHNRASLFISIHAGGFFRSGLTKWAVYHFPAKDSGGTEEPGPGKRQWGMIQQRHAGASSRLAETVARYLRACPQVNEVESAEAPLLLLEGLAMPAVLIEAGYITHPGSEEQLNDPDFRAMAARCIHRGIRNYLEQP